MKQIAVIAAMLFMNVLPLFAIETEELASALLTIDFRTRFIAADFEQALLQIPEYRIVSEAVKALGSGEGLSNAEAAAAKMRCEVALENLRERNSFRYQPKIHYRVMRLIDDRLLQIAYNNPRVDDFTARRISVRYGIMLREMLQYAERRYQNCLRAIASKNID